MSIHDYDSTRPPGWYPDPGGGQDLRWFSGTDWTHHYQATARQLAPPPPPTERRFTIHYGFVVVAVISLLVTLVPSIFWFVVAGSGAGDSSSDPDPAGGTAGLGAGLAVLWMLWGGMWTAIWTAFAIHHTLRGRQR
jgi:hypothetical protein